PYLGLKTFDEAHARFFYGREALIDTLVERVNNTAFLTVIGPSGSGKSSLVRAGLIPALKQGLDLAGSDQWIYVPPLPARPTADERACRGAGRASRGWATRHSLRHRRPPPPAPRWVAVLR